MLVSMALSLIQGNIVSAKAKNQRCLGIIENWLSKQASNTHWTQVTTTVGHFYVTLTDFENVYMAWPSCFFLFNYKEFSSDIQNSVVLLNEIMNSDCRRVRLTINQWLTSVAISRPNVQIQITLTNGLEACLKPTKVESMPVPYLVCPSEAANDWRWNEFLLRIYSGISVC